MRPSRLRVFAATLPALLLPVYGHAQPILLGSEFVVSSDTQSTKQAGVACMHPNGDFVVAWSEPGGYSSQSTGRDGSLAGVFARRFGGDATPKAADFQVNTYTSGNQFASSAACMADGHFVVAWTSESGYDPAVQQLVGKDGSFAQAFDTTGASVGTELAISTAKRAVTTCANGGNEFLVVWQPGYPAGDLKGLRFDSTGQSVGTEFDVESDFQHESRDPRCCGGSNGFVVVWGSGSSDYNDLENIFAQRLSSTGQMQGTFFEVNTYTTLSQTAPAVACAPDGGFMVTWSSGQGGGYFTPGQDGSAWGVFGRRFDASGQPAGTDFQINTITANSQYSSDVAVDAGGNYLVVWQDQGAVPDDIKGQVYSASGDPLGTEFLISTSPVNQHQEPVVAAGSAGTFVVAWRSYQIGVQDYHIRAQRVGLSGVTTTTVTTTTLPATTTTLPAGGVCGDPVDPSGATVITRTVTATDALVTLQTAVGSASCDPCICDVNSSGSITATDALLVLQHAVGQPVGLDCPPCS